MALINYKNKFIYIHPYKCAGTSIRHYFANYSEEIGALHCTFAQVNSAFNKIRPNDSLGQYFIFSSVRNPFDQLVSLYEYTKNHQLHPWYNHISLKNFSSFISWYVTTKLNKSSTINGPICQMTEYIMNEKGHSAVDYIIRFEDITKGVKHVSQKLKIHYKPILKLNESDRKFQDTYRQYYNYHDIQLVRHYFKKDLDFFGYSF